MLNFIEVKDSRLIDVLNNVARSIWHEYYQPLLGDFAVKNMLESLHNRQKILDDLNNGFKYFILQKDDQQIGYISYANLDFDNKADIESVFINKLYIIKSFRSKGIGRLALDFIVSHNTRANNLWLLVNKHNGEAYKALNEFGFINKKEVKRDIGKGYILEEFLMVKELETSQYAQV